MCLQRLQGQFLLILACSFKIYSLLTAHSSFSCRLPQVWGALGGGFLHRTASAVSCEGSSPQYPDHSLRGRHSSYPHLYHAPMERQDAPALGLVSRLAFPALQIIVPRTDRGTPPFTLFVGPVNVKISWSPQTTSTEYSTSALAPFSHTLFSSELESLATVDSPHLRKQDVLSPLRRVVQDTEPPVHTPRREYCVLTKRLLPRRRRSEPLRLSLNCSRVRLPGPRIRV